LVTKSKKKCKNCHFFVLETPIRGLSFIQIFSSLYQMVEIWICNFV